jgi:hypothetical protein
LVKNLELLVVLYYLEVMNLADPSVLVAMNLVDPSVLVAMNPELL